MSTILVLLLLLSIATLASRPAALSGLFDRLSTPLLILLGIGCAPRGLALLSSSLVESLEPALAVGVTWLGIVSGLRSASRDVGHADGGRATMRAAVVVVSSTMASVLLAMAALAAPHLLGLRGGDSAPLLIGAALILGGALVGSPPVDRDNRVELALRSHLIDVGDLIAVACAIVALAILPAWSPLPPSMAAVVVVGSGLLLALVQRLLGGSATNGDPATRTIALFGVVAVGAGLLHDAGLPSAVAGLVAGAALGRTELGRVLREALAPTERPARIVVVFLVGTMMPLTPTSLLAGGLLAAGQLAVQLVATSWAVGHRPSARALATGLSSSSVPLVVAASYALAGLPEGELLLATAAVAVVTTDVLAATIGLGTRWQFPAGALSTPPSAALSTPPTSVQR
jgi:hypothetical protein